MPPLALTQLKYASAMLGMSVKLVPGWSVAIAPSLIGEPVAFTPGFFPHSEVLIPAVFGVAPLLETAPNPAQAAKTIQVTNIAIGAEARRNARLLVPISPSLFAAPDGAITPTLDLPLLGRLADNF